MSRWIILCVCLAWSLNAQFAQAQNADATRGKTALETRAFAPAYWPMSAYEKAWEFWTPKPAKKPADYAKAFAAYYGLHEAPFKNGGLPLGLRKGPKGIGITYDCMICHGGSVAGTSYVGLGNATLDLQAFLEDMNRASGVKAWKPPYAVANVRGTNEAFAMTEFLLAFRNADLSVRKQPVPWKFADNLCEDVPAWWLLKKKKTMYHGGSHNAKSVRSIMQFMLDPGNSLAAIKKEEATFRDIQAYLLSLEAPKYPFPIVTELAAQGQKLFVENCAGCHGTYGANPTYPSKIVPLKTIGTDATRVTHFTKKYFDFYNQTWFAEEGKGMKAEQRPGYQAPPLDGVWATAPYLHNGSVPTLYDMLNSKTRPKLFTRSFRTGNGDYDKKNVGWIVQELPNVPKNLTPHDRRMIYDTTQPGRGNGGHTFGDDFSEQERRAVIEYLKTL